MTDFGNKLISRVGAKKKNVLIWTVIALLFGAFGISIYSGIDLSGAIDAANQKRDEIPDLTEMETKGAAQESWSIDIENRIDSIEERQHNDALAIADQTKNDIIEANKYMLADIQRDNKLLSNRMDEINNQNKDINQRINNGDIGGGSGGKGGNILGIPLPSGKRVQPNEGNVQLPGLVPNRSSQPRNQPQSPTNNSNSGDDLLGQINIVPTKPGQEFNANSGEQPQQYATATKKRQLYYSKAYTNTFAENNNTKSSKKDKSANKMPTTYEVVTGFTEAYMITGAYAPLMIGRGGSGGGGFGGGTTGVGGAQGSMGGQNNVPVLLEAQGDAIFPNQTIGSIDKCMLIGTATGNASSLTVDIRFDKMTCLLHGGKKVIDGKITGWVVSETGTPGVPATMVYRAGDYISRVIASGVLEGLSQGLVSAAGSYNTNVGTTPSYVYNGAVNGAGTGVGNAFSKLSEFYLGLAESTLPTLEVKGGRFVSIILNGGDKFTVRDIDLLDTREIDRYVNKFVGSGKK